VLATSAASRCAAPIALSNPGEHWVDFDADSGDECVISDAGSTCMDADVAGPVRFDGLDTERRSRNEGQSSGRRSPGLARDFFALSNEEFRMPYGSVPDSFTPPQYVERDDAPVFDPNHPIRRLKNTQPSAQGDSVAGPQDNIQVPSTNNNIQVPSTDEFQKPVVQRDNAAGGAGRPKERFQMMSNEDFRKPYEERDASFDPTRFDPNHPIRALKNKQPSAQRDSAASRASAPKDDSPGLSTDDFKKPYDQRESVASRASTPAVRPAAVPVRPRRTPQPVASAKKQGFPFFSDGPLH
jgi:hypothetical protein